jgi:hypothetical protein
VLRHIVAAAEERIAALPMETGGTDGATPSRDAGSGDRLMKLYVQRAAEAAARFDEQEGRAAFLLALGIAMDDLLALRTFPRTASFVRSVETEEALVERQKKMGQPSMFGRPDLAKHFFVSAYLATAVGRTAAEVTGEAKELLDAAGKSGFSFADMAANRAGIVFAERVLSGKVRLTALAAGFSVEDYMPAIADLDEGLSLSEFREKYGGKSDKRYTAQVKEIDKRIEAQPGYRGGD